MNIVGSALSTYFKDTKGSPVIEYALIAAFIAIGLIATLMTIGGQTAAPFNEAAAAL